jgi:hypothetical protein
MRADIGTNTADLLTMLVIVGMGGYVTSSTIEAKVGSGNRRSRNPYEDGYDEFAGYGYRRSSGRVVDESGGNEYDDENGIPPNMVIQEKPEG